LKILLTNDDGIESRGIVALADALSQEHEVWIVAPDRERSGSSHSITLKEPTRIRKVSDRIFACGGTPADCVILSLLGIVPVSIDMIISGLNLGPNLGTDIIYSGTAAAARQGALMGKPSIAASINAYSEPFNFEPAVNFIRNNIDKFAEMWTNDHFLNINFPNEGKGGMRVRVTFPALRIYKDRLVRFTAPNGDIYCFLGGEKPQSRIEEGSDSYTLAGGDVSLSPILIHPTNHSIEEKYRSANFRIG